MATQDTTGHSLATATNGQIHDPVIFGDWYVVARSQDLQPGVIKAVRLLDTDLVLWRSQDTQVLAWEDRCPHRSVRLSNGHVVDNTLVCAYHGMVYNPAGRCIRVPAHPDYIPPKQACVRSFQVRECYDLVFVCLGEPTQDIPLFPEWQDSSFRKVLSGPHPCQSGGYRAIENFLDVAHFPFIHAHILGDPNITEIPDYEVSIGNDGVRFHNVQVWQPDPIGIGHGSFVTYQYWTPRPLTTYLRKETSDGACLTLLYCVTPVGEEECIGWMWVAANYGDANQNDADRAFQDRVVGQDLGNLESHNPKRLPLNSHTEFHVPCDRGSLAYRKWLKTLGVTYGTI